jgi:hypothetical protein
MAMREATIPQNAGEMKSLRILASIDLLRAFLDSLIDFRWLLVFKPF